MREAVAPLVGDGEELLVVSVRGRCEASDVSRWDGREHAFDLDGRDVVALIHDHVAEVSRAEAGEQRRGALDAGEDVLEALRDQPVDPELAERLRAADDGELLDAYSRAVTQAAETVSPPIAVPPAPLWYTTASPAVSPCPAPRSIVFAVASTLAAASDQTA